MTNQVTIAANSSAWLEAVLEKNVQLVSGGLSQFVQGFSDLFVENQLRYVTPLVEALDYGQRLMRAAAGVQDAGLRGQVMRSDTLSELVNLGGAYAALDPYRSISETTNHFLATLWFSEDIQKGSIQLSGSLTSSTGFEGKTFNYSRNTLLFLNSTYTKYNNQEARKSSAIESWLSDVIFYTQLENSLQGTDFVNDMSGFLNGIVTAQSRQSQLNIVETVLSYQIESNQVLIASNNNLISQTFWDGLWGGFGGGIEWLIGGIVGVSVMAISDASGKISKIIFKSESGDDRTKEEKDTDEAIGRLIEGATATGKDKKELPPGQTTPGSTKNYVKPGDSSKDFGKFAGDLGTAPDTITSSKGPVRRIDMPDGGVASEYPKATSTGGATIEIRPSRGRGLGTRIKIRYSNGTQANIYVPVQG